MRRTARKMLFEIIQESVDVIYFIEEDTITLANLVLDSVITSLLREMVSENDPDSDCCEVCDDDDESTILQQVKESLASHTFRNIELNNTSSPAASNDLALRN
jgi:hypothetical protein